MISVISSITITIITIATGITNLYELHTSVTLRKLKIIVETLMKFDSENFQRREKFGIIGVYGRIRTKFNT
jgi:hypothetical protein